MANALTKVRSCVLRLHFLYSRSAALPALCGCAVSRLRCRGENTEADCTLDVNVEIYPLKTNDKFMFALSATLAEDGTPDDGNFDQARPREGGERRQAGMEDG